MSRETMGENTLPDRQVWTRELVSRGRNSETSNRITCDAERRYDDFLSSRPRLMDDAMRMHLEQTMLPALALYQALRTAGSDEEAALGDVEYLLQCTLAGRRRLMAFLGRLPFFFFLLRVLTRSFTTRSFPPAGWETEWVEVSADLVAFNMHRCFCVDTMREYGAPELTPVFCRLDHFMYDDISPHVRFERTATLATGGDCCDFRFRRVRQK